MSQVLADNTMIAQIGTNLTVEWQESGQGTPLILLHAFPQTAQMFSRQRDGLSEIARVMCPNLRGFGASSHSSASTWGIDEMARDIASWMKHLQIESAIIGGVSMGGYVAMSLARQFPDMVRALVLADTRADADDETARQNRATMIEFARKHSSREVFEKMSPRLFCEHTLQTQPQIIEECAQIAATISRETIIATLEALRDRPDARPYLAQVQAPSLVLVGEQDAVSPLENAREMHDLLPLSHLQVLADSGHFAFIEQAASFNQLIRDLVTDVNAHKN